MEFIELRAVLTAFVIFAFCLIVVKSDFYNDFPEFVRACFVWTIMISFILVPIWMVLFIWS